MNTLTIHKWRQPTVISQLQGDNFGSFQFTLNDLQQASVLGDLFQQYKITDIVAFFRPMYRANSMLQDADYLIPQIYVAFDPNDVSNWGAISDASDADSVFINDDSAAFRMTVKPRPAMAAYAGAFTGFADSGSPWMDAGNDQIRYYGLKWAITGAGIGAAHFQSWNVTIRYQLSFRMSK